MSGFLVRVWPAVTALTVGVGAIQDTSLADAARVESKVAAIVERGADPPRQLVAPLRTRFVDGDVNAYFRVRGPDVLPEGLVAPEITIDDSGRVRARATVDLDAALKPEQRSLLDPLAWLRGKTEVTAAGVISAANGMGAIQLDTATLAGLSIHRDLLQQLVSYYTRTSELPEGFDIDQPFELPANIRAVELTRGQAIVVQP